MTRALALAALVGAAVAVVATTSRPPASPEDVANRVSGRVMSPFCPGVTLHDCPSDEAIDMRAEIVEMAGRGLGEGEIVDALVAEYGQGVRAAPEPRGAGLLAWLLPGVAVAGGMLAAAFGVRRWAAARAEPVPTEIRPEDRARLEAELAALRESS